MSGVGSDTASPFPAESMGLLLGVERLDLVYNLLEGLAKYTNLKLVLRHSTPRRGTENYN